MFSLGRIRQVLQPLVLKYWLNQRSQKTVTTRVEGFELSVFPSVFHPRYFGSSAILARFICSLDVTGKSFLDLGCGSGIIALCAARAGARVTAVDINPEAVRCTQSNAARNNLTIEATVSNLFSSLDDARFDVIAWNPPFLTGIPHTPAEAAFYGGSQLDVIQKLAADVGRHLNAGAQIYMVLSTDVDLAYIKTLFRNEGFTVSPVLSRRWGLGETMVICRIISPTRDAGIAQ
jgi:release factor glutamine methyltransferase